MFSLSLLEVPETHPGNILYGVLQLLLSGQGEDEGEPENDDERLQDGGHPDLWCRDSQT